VGNDKRLEALTAELERMVETGNEEIASAQQHLAQTISKWQTTIDQQRGRILERESMNADAAQTHENAPLSVLPGMQGAIHHEAQKEA
jgi:PIN domain nuclease of toxin-antitoxin system